MVETMAKLELVLSERFGEVDAETLRATLSNHLTVGKANRLLRRGIDPNLASVIQLIGDVANWFPLKAAATAYLVRLAIHAGDATPDWLGSVFASKEVKPLADVATALATTARKVDGEIEIALGLNMPDDHIGTCVSIKVREREEIARRQPLSCGWTTSRRRFRLKSTLDEHPSAARLWMYRMTEA